MESFRSRYVRAVVLLFSVGAEVPKGYGRPTHGVTFTNEHLVHNPDSIYYGDQLPSSTKTASAGNSGPSSSPWKKLRYNLFTNDDEYDSQLSQQQLCDIGDGHVYRQGEVLLTFETRCGSKDRFPCYCDPKLDPPIVCPYCGFHAPPSGSGNAERRRRTDSGTFFCLKDGETSDPFVGRDGINQECSCRHINDGRTNEPVSSCRPASTASTVQRDPSAMRPPLLETSSSTTTNHNDHHSNDASSGHAVPDVTGQGVETSRLAPGGSAANHGDGDDKDSDDHEHLSDDGDVGPATSRLAPNGHGHGTSGSHDFAGGNDSNEEEGKEKDEAGSDNIFSIKVIEDRPVFNNPDSGEEGEAGSDDSSATKVVGDKPASEDQDSGEVKEDEANTDSSSTIKIIEDKPILESQDNGNESSASNTNPVARAPTEPSADTNGPVASEDTQESSNDNGLDGGDSSIDTESAEKESTPDVNEVESVTENETEAQPSDPSKRTIVIDDISDAIPREFDTTTTTNDTPHAVVNKDETEIPSSESKKTTTIINDISDATPREFDTTTGTANNTPDRVESTDETVTASGESSKTTTVVGDVTDATPAVYDGKASVVENADENADVCELVIDDMGTLKTFQRGESYGDHVPNRCNDAEEFPCFCNPDLYNQIECPYCSFVTGNEGTLCAKHNDSVTFLSPDPGARKIETCRCYIPSPGRTPIEACAVEEYKAVDDPEEKSSESYQDLYPDRERPAGAPGAGGTDADASNTDVNTDADGGDADSADANSAIQTDVNNEISNDAEGNDEGNSGNADSVTETGVSNGINTDADGSDSENAENAMQTGVNDYTNTESDKSDGDSGDAGGVSQSNNINTDGVNSGGDGGNAGSVTQTNVDNDINTDGANSSNNSGYADSVNQNDVNTDTNADMVSGDNNSEDTDSGDAGSLDADSGDGSGFAMGSGDVGSGDGSSLDMGSGDMGSSDGDYDDDGDGDDWDSSDWDDDDDDDDNLDDDDPDGVIQNLQARSVGDPIRRPRTEPSDTPRPSLSPVISPTQSPVATSHQPSIRGSTAYERVKSGATSRNGENMLLVTTVCLLGSIFATIQL